MVNQCLQHRSTSTYAGLDLLAGRGVGQSAACTCTGRLGNAVSGGVMETRFTLCPVFTPPCTLASSPPPPPPSHTHTPAVQARTHARLVTITDLHWQHPPTHISLTNTHITTRLSAHTTLHDSVYTDYTHTHIPQSLITPAQTEFSLGSEFSLSVCMSVSPPTTPIH